MTYQVLNTPYERFITKFEITPSGCWIWKAGKTFDGYGKFWDGKKEVPAHRWSYEHFIGPIPEGLQLDHLCRNRACVNPYLDHLELVTSKENTLRGKSPNIELYRKNQCKNGHLITPDNSYFRKNGRPVCKTCNFNRRQLKIVCRCPGTSKVI